MARPPEFPRGIDPELLVSQVENTMPYLFAPETEGTPLASFPPATRVRAYRSGVSLDHFEYFALCLSSHYLTCGTPVPTDVDNQIRKKLWPAKLPLELALQMSALVLESRAWDFTLVSTRYVHGAPGTPMEKATLSGHLGEWFTVACGAYCAFGQYEGKEAAARRSELFSSISDEVNRHSEIFGSLWRAGDGLRCLKASASIAHNLGDLDRVMDMWDLGVGDPLRLAFYKLGSRAFDADRKLRYMGRLWVAGELYKSKVDGSSMAIENHRHFALRKPRGLRAKPELVIPTAPFFDDWAEAVGQCASAEEIFDALVVSWPRQPGSYAYGRAIRVILGLRPEFRSRTGVEDLFKAHSTRTILETPREVFEARWASEAIRHMDEIPSRAE